MLVVCLILLKAWVAFIIVVVSGAAHSVAALTFS